MSKKLFDFLSSFGVMLLGVVLLFGASVSYPKVSQKVAFLPKSNPRVAFVGGDEQPAVLPVSHPNVPLKKDNSVFGSELSAASALLLDDKTSTVMFEKNADAVRPLASITKLMSVLVLVDLQPDWKKTIEILPEDFDNDSNLIQVGEKFEMDDLWNLALVGSSNAAIRAMVRGSDISQEDFVKKMNEKAQLLRLFDTKFVEPTGLDQNNVGSARSAVKLLKESLRNEKIYNTLQIPEYYTRPIGKKIRRVWSTNWLLTRWVPNNFGELAIAGKTGYITDSKYNFAARVENQEKRAVRAIVLGAETNEDRFSEVRDLANWGFEHYVWPGDDGYEKLAE